MWKVECLETERSHVELRARERLMIAARNFQEPITEEEAKQKVLELLKVCSTRDFEGIDSKTNLPKYFVRKKIAGSINLSVIICFLEDNETKTRKIKTLHTNFDELSPDWKR